MGNELELNEEAAETEAKETELKAKETESETEEKSETEEVLDKHGNPGINRDKYQRDIKERG
ncbi:MAG: hypothetical protein PUE49_06400 [Eggerthellales bacterium]|nr:hypothetical protein [Eggerthellales bacterium]